MTTYEGQFCMEKEDDHYLSFGDWLGEELRKINDHEIWTYDEIIEGLQDQLEAMQSTKEALEFDAWNACEEGKIETGQCTHCKNDKALRAMPCSLCQQRYDVCEPCYSLERRTRCVGCVEVLVQKIAELQAASPGPMKMQIR